MVQKRTEKRSYESHYGGGWITASQRLAELACERIAGESTLGTEFWKRHPWSAIFRREVTFANRLLAAFSFQAVASAFESREGRHVRTLGTDFFKKFVEREQRRLSLQAERMSQEPTPDTVDTLETPRPMKRAGKSMRQKLEDDGTQGKLF
jgi:hypothetical protein